MTRRNLLLARSYLTVRNLTAATVTIDNDLIERANKARAEYQKALEESVKAEEEKKAKLKAKEEEEKIKQLAKQDKERKSALEKLKTKESDLLLKKREAEVSRCCDIHRYLFVYHLIALFYVNILYKSYRMNMIYFCNMYLCIYNFRLKLLKQRCGSKRPWKT